MNEKLEEELSPQREEMLTRKLLLTVKVFEGAGVSYFIAGGVGIDLLNKKWDRDHHDLDVSIFSSDKKVFIEHALFSGFFFTDISKNRIEERDLINNSYENAFASRSNADGSVDEFEVIFLDDNDDQISITRGVKVDRQLFTLSPRVRIMKKEVVLQPTEVIMFHKLIDGRRKDFNDLLIGWEKIGNKNKDFLQDLITKGKYVFLLGNRNIRNINELLIEAGDKESERSTKSFTGEENEIIWKAAN